MLSPVTGIRVEFERIGKRFGGRSVLTGVSGSLEPARILVVAGPNGSGKSTLLNILAGLMRPSRGTVRYLDGGGMIMPPAARLSRTGVAAPDMNLYEELTGTENLRFFARLRGLGESGSKLADLAERLGLARRDQDRPLATYSSGMRQRLKLAQALLHEPAVVLLDEPGSNLDREGHARLGELVEELRRTAAVAVATNDPREMAWGDDRIELAG